MNIKTCNKVAQKALEQFKQGQSLFGKDGALAPMLKRIVEAALESEMEHHLSPEVRKKGNKRNGKGQKTIKRSVGTFTIKTPEDRQSTFEPQLIRKRERIIHQTSARPFIPPMQWKAIIAK